MDTHVRVIGILAIVFGIMGLIGSAILFVAVAGGGLISGDPMVMKITSIVAVTISSLIGMLSIPEIIAGIGILKLQNWGRILGIVVAILNLMNIPFGTAFGVYALWVLLNSETEKIFKQQDGIVVEE